MTDDTDFYHTGTQAHSILIADVNRFQYFYFEVILTLDYEIDSLGPWSRTQGLKLCSLSAHRIKRNQPVTKTFRIINFSFKL